MSRWNLPCCRIVWMTAVDKSDSSGGKLLGIASLSSDPICNGLPPLPQEQPNHHLQIDIKCEYSIHFDRIFCFPLDVISRTCHKFIEPLKLGRGCVIAPYRFITISRVIHVQTSARGLMTSGDERGTWPAAPFFAPPKKQMSGFKYMLSMMN